MLEDRRECSPPYRPGTLTGLLHFSVAVLMRGRTVYVDPLYPLSGKMASALLVAPLRAGWYFLSRFLLLLSSLVSLSAV